MQPIKEVTTRVRTPGGSNKYRKLSTDDEALTETCAFVKQSQFNKTRQKKDSTGASPRLSPERQPSPQPPGPSGLPCVGSLLEWKGPETNLEWTKRYGGIYRVRMGSKELVYLNTITLIEKFMEGRKGENYLDRPMGPGAIAEGLLFGSGDLWKKNKRAFMKALHTVTFMAHMEESIQAEIKITLEELRKHTDTPIKIGDFFLPTCANAIAGLLMGENLPLRSQDRLELLKIAQSMEGVDLTSMFTQISLKHPKLREPLSKLLFKDIVDVHGTSRRLQNLLRQWIRQAAGIPVSPTSPRPNTQPTKEKQEGESSNSADDIANGTSRDVRGCPFHNNERLKNGACVVADSSSASSANSSSPDEQDEDLLTPPRNESLLESTMRNATHLVAFGFTNAGHGEHPFEEPEPAAEPGTPYTPITEKQWTFDRQMSLNLKKESILQRILKQPEFADVTEGSDAELLQSLIDMFFGGVTSTLAGIEYVLVYLTRHQDFQRIAREEVDTHVPRHNGCVTSGLKKEMPYVTACITEAMRLGSVTPSSLPHIATKDTEIEGYHIPKGTFVVASLYSIHRDPTHYLDPNEFRPQRHLDKQGRFKAPTSYKPYGVGARRCVGDKMAGMQLFLYTVYILRNFELHPISKKYPPSLDTHMRIINRLKDFRCILKKRDV